MLELENAGWVQEVPDTKKGSKIWRINQKIATVYANQREEVLRLKQAIYDEAHRKVMISGRRAELRYAPGFLDEHNIT